MKAKIKEKGLTSNQDSENGEENELEKVKRKMREVEKIRKVEINDLKRQLKEARNAIHILMKNNNDPVFMLSERELDKEFNRSSSEGGKH